MQSSMRLHIFKCLTVIALAFSSDPIAKPAFAVASGKISIEDPTSSSLLIQPGQVTNKKIELPVTWQLTRTRMVGSDSSTVTETFRETWILEIQTGGIYHLRSPRAHIPVFVSEEAQASENVPVNLTMSESNLGRLIGVKKSENETLNQPAIDRPVNIQLSKPSKQDSEILLTWSDDEHFIVQLDFSPISTL